MGVVSEFVQKPFHIKVLLCRAAFYSLYFKKRIARTEFRTYAEKIGEFKYETEFVPYDDPYIKEVKWVTYAINRWTPWQTKCFDQALMAKKLLNKKNYPCTLYMGVKQGTDGSMVAHAWLRCGYTYVSGGNGLGYAITGIYGDKNLDNKNKPFLDTVSD